MTDASIVPAHSRVVMFGLLLFPIPIRASRQNRRFWLPDMCGFWDYSGSPGFSSGGLT